MKQNTKLMTNFNDEDSGGELFIDLCKAAVALVLLGVVLFAIV